MPFHENWFGGPKPGATREFAERALGVEGAWVEVGCWEGRSTILLANLCHPRPLHAVDHFMGAPDDLSGERAQQRDVFADFSTNIAEQTQGNVVVHRMGWEQFFADFHEPIALLHVDGAHTYEQVRDNLLAAVPLVVKDGVIVGDDWGIPAVRRAVSEVLGAAEQKRATWGFVCRRSGPLASKLTA